MISNDPESAILEESMHSTENSVEGLSLDEPLADDNWIAEHGSEVKEAEQRNQALQNRFHNIRKVWTLGKQLIRILRTAIV